jgi:hypothetical protein
MTIHPLVEARADQEATDLKSKLSQIIYQGIVDRLKYGLVHADDLESLFPPEVRDVCRRLVGAQFGSLASRRYIVERERRKSSVPSRKGAKSGVFEFTKLGREKLTAGVSAGASTNRVSPASGDAGEVSTASADPGGQSAHTGDPSSTDRATNPSVPSASVQTDGGSGVDYRAPEPAARLFDDSPPSQYDPYSEEA